MASNSSDHTSSAFQRLDETAFPPCGETNDNPLSYQQTDNIATAQPQADDHNFSSASLRVPEPNAPPPSYDEAVGSVDKTHEDGLKPFSDQGGYSSFDEQSYTPRFRNEPRSWESNPSTNTQPSTRYGFSRSRTRNQGETCTDEDCKTCCDLCLVCLYCCLCLLDAFK